MRAGRLLGAARARLRATRSLWQPAPSALGAIDSPKAAEAIGTDRLRVEGWALFATGPAARIEAFLADRPLGRARLGLPRPDVATGSPDPAAEISGFELSAPIGDLPAGEAALRLQATGPQGEQMALGPVAVSLGERPEAEDRKRLPPPAPSTPPAPQRPGVRLLAATHRLDLGGAQLYLCELLEALVEAGAANPTVISSVDGPLRARLEEKGIPVHVSSPLPDYDPAAHIGRVEELSSWAAGRDFEAVLVNTASSFAFPAAEVAQRLNIAAIWAIHESYRPKELWAELDPGVRELGEAALRRARLAIFESATTMELYRSHLGEEQCLALPYGIDLEAIDSQRQSLDPRAIREQEGIPPDAQLIICLGAIEPRKAQIPLAQAFAAIAEQNPKAHLRFLGDWGDEASTALSHYCASLPCSDRIEVMALTEDVHRHHAIADLLACPSDIESLPRAVLEAMAWHTPVLASDVFGLAELIEDGESGWLCPPRDTEALAGALQRALGASQVQRSAIAALARERIEREHTLQGYARRFAGLLEGVVGSGGAGGNGSVPHPSEREATPVMVERSEAAILTRP